MKKILVLNGHPDEESLSAAFAEKYFEGATASGFDVKLIHLAKLSFDPILHKGYREIQELEPDLVQAQKDIHWAEHIVVIYPMWWGSVPALLKGFIDRVFLPGFAFRYHKSDPFWDRLLKGRTGHIIMTTDAPWWFNWIKYGDPQIRMMKKTVMQFSGITPVRVTQFDSIKSRKPADFQKYLQKVFKLGQQGR